MNFSFIQTAVNESRIYLRFYATQHAIVLGRESVFLKGSAKIRLHVLCNKTENRNLSNFPQKYYTLSIGI